MNTEQLQRRIQQYLETEVLEGRDIGLRPDTPLLELGLLNSMEVSALMEFTRTELGVTIRRDAVTARAFRSIEAIAATILASAVEGSGPEGTLAGGEAR